MPQKWEMIAPKIISTEAMAIPFVAAKNGRVIVPGPRIATIRVKIDPLIPPGLNFLLKYLAGETKTYLTFSILEEWTLLFGVRCWIPP